jgi:hypothetical protein
VSGVTHEKERPVGRHPLQLYSLGTPNGVKVTVMLEELLALGHASAEYDAWLIKIGDGDQFGSGLVSVNPNSKIPTLLDRSGATPVCIRRARQGRPPSSSPGRGFTRAAPCGTACGRASAGGQSDGYGRLRLGGAGT